MGEGGLSYVGQGFLGDASAAAHEGPGEVLIVPAVAGCRCDYRCVALDEYRSITQCICPERWKLAPDNVSCVSSGDPSLPTIIWLVMAIVAIILLFIALGGTCFCLWRKNTLSQCLKRQQGGSAAHIGLQTEAGAEGGARWAKTTTTNALLID
ncbi:Tyrosine-protein kinase receptor [Gryllus bimaculatus]|nr:Tyrosine-protein kinase receptor [Gryllus bimaculatus]